MKRIIVGLIVIGFIVYKVTSDENQDGLKSQVTISDLKNNPSVFVDSVVVLHDLEIIEATSVMNYSKAIVADKSGEEIILFNSKSYKKGEHIPEIAGKYVILFRDNNKEIDIFIAEDLNLKSNLIKVAKLLL